MSTPSGAPSHPAPPAGGQDGAAVDQRVAVITLGCARNEVDSEELAGRLAGEGWRLVPDPDDADVVLVNTCGFIEAAKKDSIDTVLELSGGAAKVVATGCLAERYGRQLADSLPEADAVFGFDEYPRIGAALAAVVAGERPPAHEPRDRRTLLPITPAARREASAAVAVPGHGPQIPRRRLADAVWAPLKLASGCDRRCAFCAIPSFRGAYVSRTPEEILAEARWLAEQGVRELFLVSENTTSYGKDLGDLRLLETLLPELARIDGIEWLRLSYLQPAELRPGMIEVLCDTDKVVPYFDLSFQHASEAVLRRMRRFGNPERFGQLLDRIRQMQPQAGIRTNVILGFPGETEDDVAVLERFLTDARLDVVGVFGYSDEEGTEATGFDDHVAQPLIAERVERVSSLVEELMTQRAEDRVHDRIDVIVEAVEQPGAGGPAVVVGRGAHQAPEVDGGTTMRRVPGARVGDVVRGRVVAVDGVDLIAEHVG